jgi:FkbM family methyltransferase
MHSPDPNLYIRRRVCCWANKFLSPLGIAIIETERPKWMRRNSVVTTQIGRYAIQVPSNNPISSWYLSHPNYSSQLGRLTSLARNKFPNLAVIDIGANVGDTACIIKTAEDVPLLCIEGDDYTFSFLQKNVAQFKNTTAHKMFLGEKTVEITAQLEKSGWNTTIKPAEASSSASRMSITSLDDFILTRPDVDTFKLLKIDTEGFDCSIIRGAKQFIQRVSPVITFEFNRENMDAINEPGIETLFMLADLGYSHIAFHDSHGRFLCATTLNDRGLIHDLYNFADGNPGRSIFYYDLTVFSKSDNDIALAFMNKERAQNERNHQIQAVLGPH